MLKTRSLKKIDLKNWPSILNVRFELTIDFIKKTERNVRTFLCCDKCLGDRVDNIFYKLTLDVFDRYQILYIRSMLGL